MTIYNHTFKSTMLDSCSYNSDDQELTVVFQNGKSYIFKEVPFNTYTDLTTAKSAGVYFNQIKASLVQK
jgi:hypothetical protein